MKPLLDWVGRFDKAQREELLATLIIAVVMIVGGFLYGWLTASPARADEIPAAAYRYRAELTRNARLAWGLEAPVATFAAQVQQESGWNPAAVSRVGARGLGQFMQATAEWIGRVYPDLAAPGLANSPENPAWALRALTAYDRWLWDRIQAATGCDRMAMVLSSYNGGLGWLRKDQALARRRGDDPGRWWQAVERHNAGRHPDAFAENRGYPARILRVIEPRYAAWGRGACAAAPLRGLGAIPSGPLSGKGGGSRA